jgi:hypothetical protein
VAYKGSLINFGKNQLMKRQATFFFALLGSIAMQAQDMNAIRRDFEEKLKDPAMTYGRNPAAGKYYHIHGG